jgi:hypothetical protein
MTESSTDILKKKIAERQRLKNGGKPIDKKLVIGRFTIPKFRINIPPIITKFVAVVRNDIEWFRTGRKNKTDELIRKKEVFDDFMENYFQK